MRRPVTPPEGQQGVLALRQEEKLPMVNKVTALLTVLSTAMTIYITFVSSRIDAKVKLNDVALRDFQAHLDERIKTADLDLRRTIEDRAARQAADSFNLQIYEKVYVALQTNDKRKHDVAYALVQSLEEDKALKKYFLGLFQTGIVAPETRKAAAVSIFQIDQQSVGQPGTSRAPGAGEAQRVSYDVFWCEGREGNRDWEKLALAAADRIRAQEGVGRVRTRMLPEDVNKESRFRVSGRIIRIDPGEEKLGRQLKTWIDPVIAPDAFKLDGNSQGTPNYLSAFVCGT
jgi:hypothetical protein